MRRLGIRRLTLGVATVTALGVGSSAQALECVGYYELSDSIVLAEVTSIRKTKSRRWFFRGAKEWTGRAQVVRVLDRGKVVPRTFTFQVSDEDSECRGPDPIPRKGEQLVFGLTKVFDYAGSGSPRPTGRWRADEVDTLPSFRRFMQQ
jgi:hypothetical protein